MRFVCKKRLIPRFSNIHLGYGNCETRLLNHWQTCDSRVRPIFEFSVYNLLRLCLLSSFAFLRKAQKQVASLIFLMKRRIAGLLVKF